MRMIGTYLTCKYIEYYPNNSTNDCRNFNNPNSKGKFSCINPKKD